MQFYFCLPWKGRDCTVEVLINILINIKRTQVVAWRWMCSLETWNCLNGGTAALLCLEKSSYHKITKLVKSVDYLPSSMFYSKDPALDPKTKVFCNETNWNERNRLKSNGLETISWISSAAKSFNKVIDQNPNQQMASVGADAGRGKDSLSVPRHT